MREGVYDLATESGGGYVGQSKTMILRVSFHFSKGGKLATEELDGDCVELIHGSFDFIGFDDSYIIVKRNKNAYLTVIIYKQMNYIPEKGILGPFNLKDFNEQKKKLNIKANFNPPNWREYAAKASSDGALVTNIAKDILLSI